jgi:phenylacetate-CoA ligase
MEKVLFIFKQASKKVPAYKKFLQEKNVNPREVNNIGDYNKLVPQTTKENYVQAFSLTERCLNGRFPAKGSLEESAGTSGMSTLWIRSQDEEADNLSMIKATMKYLYDFDKEERYIVLNSLMIGGWTGGLRFASRIGSLGIVRNIGPDAQKLIRCITELGDGFTYIIGGYPPFIIELIEYGSKLKDFDWTNYKVNIFTGGEGFVEEWRNYVSSRLRKGAKIFSDYGAIDLDVGIAMETPFTIAIRKLLKEDIELRNDILSSERLPCFIGQYSPQRFYIREIINKDNIKELEISVLNLKASSPKIKYVIGDEGGIIRFQDICRILEMRGYSIEKLMNEFNLSTIIPFPLVFIYGRSDGTVTINGAIISPSEIYEAILSDNELVSAINTFKLSAESDTDNFIRLFIFLEARKTVEFSDSLISKCNDILISKLLESNECFRISYKKNPAAARPVINVIPFQTGIFTNKSGFLKHVYIK